MPGVGSCPPNSAKSWTTAMSGLGARSFRCDGAPIEPYGGGDEIDFDEEDGFDYERRHQHHRKPRRRLERHHPRRKTAHDANMVVPDAYHWARCIRGACLCDRLGLEARAGLDVCGGANGVHNGMRGDMEYLEAKLAEADDEIRRLAERLRGVGANRYWEGRWRDANAEIERMKRKQGTFCNQCGRNIDPTTEYLTEIIAGRFICDDCVLKQPEKKTSDRENPLPVVCTGVSVVDED